MPLRDDAGHHHNRVFEPNRIATRPAARVFLPQRAVGELGQRGLGGVHVGGGPPRGERPRLRLALLALPRLSLNLLMGLSLSPLMVAAENVNAHPSVVEDGTS
jgi:hypothetical protein